MNILQQILSLLDKNNKDLAYATYINPYLITDIKELLIKYNKCDKYLEDKLDNLILEMMDR